MTDREKIRAEVERQIDEVVNPDSKILRVLIDIRNFIDSLPEETDNEETSRPNRKGGREMTDAEIIADIFGCPCSYSPIDEELLLSGECDVICGNIEVTDAKCWQRYFDYKRKEAKK